MPQQVRGEDLEDPTTYIVSFDEGEARYAVFNRTGIHILSVLCGMLSAWVNLLVPHNLVSCVVK